MHHPTSIKPTALQQAATAPVFASILIVDDEKFDRTRLKRLCHEFDFTTHVAEADSLEAMRIILKKDRFDMILLDYHLPDGTGLDGVELIRADHVNRTAATLMITGTEQNNIALRALKLGFSDYLTKDEISGETLNRAVISALQKSQLARGMAVSVSKHDETLQSFSRKCAHDIKPIVSRMMRQMRTLRDIDKLEPEDAQERVERMEGSLRRLWSFLDDLDDIGAAKTTHTPSIPSSRGPQTLPISRINAMVPSERPGKPETKPVKPPSIFRRRPD
ncbi:response regulator [Sulfitobacter sp. S223]|uniref:response regulator n=1 Tax=Sulfitobacter sp. S223 TaxID=2867023 RepID=UPI0021A37305|nr:response regulator [Sulfitobacter sp. S223]UWR27201.1 response regulator [Sulfitobacter sp. S223]